MATIKELMQLDFNTFNSMTKNELKAAVRTAADVAAKRLNRIKDKGLSTPASRAFEDSGGKVSVKGKDINALRSELARTLDFLKAETSTISGYRDFKADVVDAIKDKGGVDISDADFEAFWKAYDKLKESDPIVATHSMRYLAMEELTEVLKSTNNDPEEAVRIMSERMKKRYEEYQENLIEATGLSNFFDL